MSKKPEKIELPSRPSNIPSGPVPTKQPFEGVINDVKKRAQNTAEQELRNLRHGRIKKLEELRKSKIIVYYSWDMLDHTDAQQFYEILELYSPKIKNIDLFILSPGGFSDPAFKISRLCQEYTQNGGRFSVLIPYYAKSAATILALGADEIIMGPSSELGPIDPQIQISDKGGRKRMVPLLALRDALKFIKDDLIENPSLTGMYWPQMESIDIMSLGHYNREIESAKQYAIQLLQTRMFRDDKTKAEKTAEKLVDFYKNHRYVIDRKESKEELELNIVDAKPDEWDAMWQLHKLYDIVLRDFRQEKKLAVKIFETSEVTSVLGIPLQQLPETSESSLFKNEEINNGR